MQAKDALRQQHARFLQKPPPAGTGWWNALREKIVPPPHWPVESSADPRMAMTSVNEQRYMEWYAANLYQGHGAVVELGCWLGSLTRALCRGLVHNRRWRTDARVEVFDYFQWDSVMESWVAGTPVAGRVLPGGDYEAVFRERVAEFLPMLAIHHADLTTERWPGGPIEFLLVDAMKAMSTTRNICRHFYPSFVPGRSYLAHQDFLHFFHSWIHVTMYLLRDCFEWVFEVPESDTVVFRCVRPVPARDFPESLAGFSSAEIGAAFDWAEQHVSAARRDMIAAARAMAHLHRGETEMGKELVQRAMAGEYAGSVAFQRLKEFTIRFDMVRWD